MNKGSLLLILLLLTALLGVGSPAVKADDGGPWWVKTYGGSNDDWANAVAVAENGDIIVAGVTYSFGAGGADVWVLRLDSEGNVKWQKTYGGSRSDGAFAVAVAENGDVIVAGYYHGDVWVLRLDGNGNVKWQKTYGGSDVDVARAVVVAPNGDVIVAGYTKSFGAGSYDVWVLRLDENGNVKWQKTYGGSEGDGATAVAIAPNGDIIVAGGTYSFGTGDVWVLRLDKNGNIKWQKTYGGSDWDEANAVAVAENGDIIVAGYTFSFGAGKSDAWVLRLPSDGNLPDWKFCKDSNAQVESTNAEVHDTNAEIHDTNAQIQDTNAQVETLWPTGTLEVTSDPPGAKVYVDGDYKGETPLMLELSPGTYTVKLTKEDYEEYTKTVTITAGKTTTLSASLVVLSPPTSSTTTTPPASSSETSPAQTSSNSTFNPLYIAGALISILLVGGIAAKAKGGKPKPQKPAPKEKRPRKTPHQGGNPRPD